MVSGQHLLFRVNCRRVAQAFDLGGITDTVGALCLRVFCKEPARGGAWKSGGRKCRPPFRPGPTLHYAHLNIRIRRYLTYAPGNPNINHD